MIIKNLEKTLLKIQAIKILFLKKIMSGDYETLEINQPEISYFHKGSKSKTAWLEKLISEIEERKNKISRVND